MFMTKEALECEECKTQQFYLTHISDFGGTKKLEGMEFRTHNGTNEEIGGLNLTDKDGIVPAAIKDIAIKVAKRIAQG